MALPRIIAIDGPAASGKSTLGEKLAAHLGFLYFDTGVMYRAVTWAVLRAKIQVKDEYKVTRIAEGITIDVYPATINDGRKSDVYIDGVDVTWEIRSNEVEENVSQVSTYSGVRSAMTTQQRRIVEKTLQQSIPFEINDKFINSDAMNSMGGVVMVGRDIGTVVVPEAELKIYLVASIEERARRRYEETLEINPQVVYEDIYQSMLRRDNIDSTRTIAPLKPADDAIILNTDGLNIEEVLYRVLELLK